MRSRLVDRPKSIRTIGILDRILGLRGVFNNSREIFGDKYARLRPAQRDDGRIVDDAQWWQRSSNCVGDIIRREMRVVLFRDARVGVAELNGDHAHRNGPPG
jgi:hypothetical protein